MYLLLLGFWVLADGLDGAVVSGAVFFLLWEKRQCQYIFHFPNILVKYCNSPLIDHRMNTWHTNMFGGKFGKTCYIWSYLMTELVDSASLIGLAFGSRAGICKCKYVWLLLAWLWILWQTGKCFENIKYAISIRYYSGNTRHSKLYW